MLSFSGIIFTYQRKSSLFFLIQWWRTSFIKYIIWSFIWKLAEGSVTLWAKYWAIKRQVTREFALLKIQTFKKIAKKFVKSHKMETKSWFFKNKNFVKSIQNGKSKQKADFKKFKQTWFFSRFQLFDLIFHYITRFLKLRCFQSV